MSERRDTRASSTSPAAMSGIDLSIFNDGEEDAFGWLLYNNAAVSATASTETAETAMFNPAGNFSRSDDIEIDCAVVRGSIVEKLQVQAAISSTANVAQPNFCMPGTQFREDIKGVTSASIMLPNARQLDHDNLSDSVNCSGENNGVTGENYSINTKKKSKRRSRVIRLQSTKQTILPRSHNTRAKCTANASVVAESQRPLQYKKIGAVSSTTDCHGLVKELEKKQIRRVKNLASVREFRKRKTKQLEQNEARLRQLEADNMDLKMRLKIGKEAILGEQREKQQIKEQMRQMLQQNANEQEIAQFLNMYKVTYSDYGPKRREKLHFHLSRIRELLLPTQVTKMSLYSVEQGVDLLRRDDHVIQDDPPSASDSTIGTTSLWNILAEELEVSCEQQSQILERRVAIKKVRDDLNHTLSIVKKLEEVIDEKNTALEAQVAQLQRILTPTQATKFIIWVKENPAFMYMLDKLVDSTLHNSSSSIGE
ncbi:camp responsive element modulator [Plasmopara halstedii]|uniref:Camp responsive element modulator n=1 Tax=Plasmopara halstedii TaxID=4781 RepID=A0A0P1AUJ1_PLAHL|nr:camp responsive element modulator [Plasmopara halstedii]CEG46024.1 camp responsive element modulator [Plasmopara halstedii]|eukprot:XP_024582393.1 camp responsive element modulator [Plasmopara halstedii]